MVVAFACFVLIFHTLCLCSCSKLEVSPTIIENSSQIISVSFSNIPNPTPNDYIGLFNATNDAYYYQHSSPMQWKYNEKWLDNGTLHFQIINYQALNYVFVYFGKNDTSNNKQIICISNPITYRNAFKPINIRIGLVPNNNNKTSASSQEEPQSFIAILWTQKVISNHTQIEFGLKPSKLTEIMNITNLQWNTYRTSNFCDINASYSHASHINGYWDPGYAITAILDNLTHPNTRYYYRVGDSSYGFSDILNFTSPSLMTQNGDQGAKLIIFGDLGAVPVDYSDTMDMSGLHSINTTNCIINQGWLDRSDILFHIGDICYAYGYLSNWDVYLDQIGLISSYIPYMTALGNHEYSWSGMWTPNDTNYDIDVEYIDGDSGGECGVAYYLSHSYSTSILPNNESFPPNSMNYDVVPWYYIDYNSIRNIIMSTEHDFSVGSLQWNWIKNILQSTDRNQYPWIFLMGHRPLYALTNITKGVQFSEWFQLQIVPLIEQYNVSVGLWAHFHAYGRTCPIKVDYNNTVECVEEGEGSVHLQVGMAGANLNGPNGWDPPSYYETALQYYGFVYFDVINDTHLDGYFINAQNNRTLDRFWIVNRYFPS